jgi:hypothetical protein
VEKMVVAKREKKKKIAREKKEIKGRCYKLLSHVEGLSPERDEMIAMRTRRETWSIASCCGTTSMGSGAT